MTKINIYSKTGTKTAASVPTNLATEANIDLIAQAVHVYQDRMHPGNRTAKTRADVSITKKKIYRQKGTGNARHGAASAPIFVGGGVAHGPKTIKRVLKLSKAMKEKASKGALFAKITDSKVASIDLSKLTKTKDAANLVNVIRKDMKTNARVSTLVVLSDENSASNKALRNIANLSVVLGKNLNAFDVSQAGLVILDSKLINTK